MVVCVRQAVVRNNIEVNGNRMSSVFYVVL